MDKPFNTLAQSVAKYKPESVQLITGYGSDATNRKLTDNRARRKLITQSVAHKLIEYAESEGDAKAVKKYWNIYYCHNVQKKSKGRTYGGYCKNKLCSLCAANRKAELIRKYLPVISEWKDPYFVTLTAKACKAHQLDKRIDNVLRAFQIIKNRFRDRHRRRKMPKFKGIRSIECNFNQKKRTYNPHIHLIIEGEDMAEALRLEWAKLWTENFVNIKGQYKRNIKREKVDDLIETIKYSTKIFTEVDNDKKGTTRIYIAAIHTIDKALAGHQLFRSFGFTLPKEATREPKGTRAAVGVNLMCYDRKQANWINDETDEVLAPYFPDIDLLMKLQYHMDHKRK